MAALDAFGHSGFDAASTRAIAAAAGVNQALIGYHFGGKQGLYLGVVEHIVSQMQQRLDPVADGVRRSLAVAPANGEERRELALQQLVRISHAFFDMIGEQAAAGWVRLMLREQQDPTEAFELFYTNLMGRMIGLVTHLVATASGLDEASEACRIRALMLLGQVLVFNTARATTSRHMGWGALGPDNIAVLKQQVRIVLEGQFSAEAASS